VLLLHGLGTSADRTWRDNGWIDLLADVGRDVIAPDLLGHGAAPKPHDPGAYALLEDAVAEALPPAPVDCIAFSLGATVALRLAIDDATRFRRLVVAGVGANLFRDDDAAEAIARVLDGSDPGAADDDPTARYFAQLARSPDNDPLALAALLRRPRPGLTAGDLRSVTVPVLVVLGDRDFAGPADPLVDALPDARLLALRGVDHFATPKDLRFIDTALEFVCTP
jgi:pimeloyl-ACP methyl ester carboxylesterase